MMQKPPHCLLLAAIVLGVGCSRSTSPTARVTGDHPPTADARAPTEKSDAGRGERPADSYPCRGVCPNEGVQPRPVPGPRPVCPETQPQPGDSCQDNQLLCSYGDQDDLYCRSSFKCVSGTWTLPEPQTIHTGECKKPPVGWCLAKQKPGEQCEPSTWGSPGCVYGEDSERVTCYCEAFGIGASVGGWYCYGPPADLRCPSAIPPIGTACGSQGVECNYGPLDCTRHPYASVFCFEGQWQEGIGPACDL